MLRTIARTSLILGILLLTVQAAQAQNPSQRPARIAIILDDLGYNRTAGNRALQLPETVSVAVIPFTPYGQSLARQAHAQGRDVLLHMPMESMDSQRRLDDGGITLAHSEAEIRHRVSAAIDAVPGAIGMNNHMGSQITIDPVIMGWVMGEVKKTPMFFIDSMTNSNSVAGHTAHHYNIPSIRRDVFLDNSTNLRAIDASFNKLITLARRNGHAVAIGHPHSNTLTYLEKKLPQLEALGIELVAVSRLTAQYGQPVDKPLQLQDLMRRIIAMPAPSATHLNFAN